MNSVHILRRSMEAIRLTAWERPCRAGGRPDPRTRPGRGARARDRSRALPLRPAPDALARRSAAVRASLHARPRDRRHRGRARSGSRGPRAGRVRPGLRPVGVRPLQRVQRRCGAPVRGRTDRARRRTRSRRRPGGVRGRPLAAPPRRARWARPRRRRTAGRCRAHALPRDPPRSRPARTGDERDRDRRRRARARRRPDPEGAQPCARRRRGPP